MHLSRPQEAPANGRYSPPLTCKPAAMHPAGSKAQGRRSQRQRRSFRSHATKLLASAVKTRAAITTAERWVTFSRSHNAGGQKRKRQHFRNDCGKSYPSTLKKCPICQQPPVTQWYHFMMFSFFLLLYSLHSSSCWCFASLQLYTLFFSSILLPLNVHSGSLTLHRTLRILVKKLERMITHNSVQKVKTIGNTVLAVAGIDKDCTEPFTKVFLADLQAQEVLSERSEFTIGISSGACFGAVIGVKGLCFDIFGDTVNTASRMCTTTTPGSIQLTDQTRLTALALGQVPTNSTMEPTGNNN